MHGVRTKGQRTKGHEGSFSVEFFFQIKCTSIWKYNSSRHIMNFEINWHFCLSSSVSPFCFIFLYFVERVIKRCYSIVAGLTSRAKVTDIAWDKVLAQKSWKLDSIVWRINLRIIIYFAPLLRCSDLLAKNRKFFTPSYLAPSFGVTLFEFLEKLYGSWN